MKMEFQRTNIDIENKKNFRQKKWREKNSVVFDFNIYKLNNLIQELDDEYYYHPDVDALSMILDMYVRGEIDITWVERYPMPDIDFERFA